MNLRAAQLGGQLSINSASGCGSRPTFAFPLK